MGDVTIIVPVKDEEKGLEYLLSDFSSSNLGAEYQIEFVFVIDERTTDNSKQIARNFSECIIDQKETHGKGAAINQAVNYLGKNMTPKVVFLDADGSYSFSAVRDIIIALDGEAEVISGSRFRDSISRPLGMSRMHNFGNRILSRISSIRNGRKISDLCTGLWGFKSQALRQIDIQSSGFDLEAEIVGLCRKMKLCHKEIPVEWSQRKGGASKLRSMRDGFIIMLRIIRT